MARDYYKLVETDGTSRGISTASLGVSIDSVSGFATLNKSLNGSPLVTTSYGDATGKTAFAVAPGTLVTTAVTADQVILTHTVTTGKTLYVQSFSISARLTTFAGTATDFGSVSLEVVAGSKKGTWRMAGAGIDRIIMAIDEPMPVAAGVVIRLVCTPAATTSYTWQGNIIGYEK